MSVPPFDHLVLTRFSAAYYEGAPPQPAGWLRERLALFDAVCFRSLTGQADAEFRWLVFFDDRCPDDFRSEIHARAAGAFEPVWGHDAFHQVELPRAVARVATRPYLITTRVDSDDAVAADFVAAVQAQFAGQERLFVNFGRGLQVDLAGAVYRRDLASGPFLSLIERRVAGQPPLTVFGVKHARARAEGPVREVRGAPAWLQVVHGSNMRNIVVGRRTAPGVVARRFRVDLDLGEPLPALRLAAERARHRRRLLGLWARHPGVLVEAVEAAGLRLRGTHTRPQDPGATTLSERIRPWAIRLGYRPRGW